MKDANYYIKKVFEEVKTADEAKTLRKEVDEWLSHADNREISIFRDSGAGEMLYLMCG